MKTKAFNDLKSKDIETLVKNLGDLEKQIVNDFLELKMGKVQNVHATSNKKKDIARLKTLIKMKEITNKDKKATTETKVGEIAGSSVTSYKSVTSKKKEKINAAN